MDSNLPSGSSAGRCKAALTAFCSKHIAADLTDVEFLMLDVEYLTV